jgi:hypothetical protein
MRDVILEANVGQDVLLLARRGAFSRLPRALQVPARAQMVLPRLAAMPDAMRQLRMYCADSGAQGVTSLPDNDVLRIVQRQIDTGELQAIVLPRPIPAHIPEKGTAKGRAGASALAAQARLSTPPMQSAAVGAALQPPSSVPNSAPSPSRPVAQWPIEDRVAEVIRRAVPKVPGDIGETLLSLLSPESLAIVVATIAISAAANLTPYGWAADAVIVGIAFGFGGMAAIHALGDLVACFRQTVAAKSIQDLDEAADALARAVVGLGTVGLMVILHRIAVRRTAKSAGGGGGSGGQTEAETAASRAGRRRPRPTPSQNDAVSEQSPEAPRSAARAAPAAEPTKADLDAYRARLNVPEGGNTIAIGRTNVPGLENEVFEGASPSIRKQAGLPDLDAAAPDRPIRSPNRNPLASRHAEEDLANDFVAKVEAAGLKPSDLDGKTLNIHISNDGGVCRTCMQGLKEGSNAPPGVLKQLSERYPGLTIRTTAEGGDAFSGGKALELRNGQIVN